MAKTKKASATQARRRTAKKRVAKAPLWTSAEVALLKKEVAKGPSLAAAFARVGKATGRRPETVQAKWYTMNKKARKKPSRGANQKRSDLTQYSPKRTVARTGASASASVGSFELEMGKLLGMLEASDVPAAIKAQAERVWQLRS